mmetsp:Transcript_23116/g.56099  ORF Transcript_23116/g.56099 Transcript_23116/m.56099 type:complete len:83 (+) Transcript_23116:2109-2357(+)
MPSVAENEIEENSKSEEHRYKRVFMRHKHPSYCKSIQTLSLLESHIQATEQKGKMINHVEYLMVRYCGMIDPDYQSSDRSAS